MRECQPGSARAQPHCARGLGAGAAGARDRADAKNRFESGTRAAGAGSGNLSRSGIVLTDSSNGRPTGTNHNNCEARG